MPSSALKIVSTSNYKFVFIPAESIEPFTENFMLNLESGVFKATTIDPPTFKLEVS